MLKKNEIYQMEITGMTSEGNGVGKITNEQVKEFAVFVPDTAVGDICEVLLVKVLKSYAFGKMLKIIMPSVDRIEIDCPAYTKCGGCSYRYISYAAELALKQDYVENAFKRIGGVLIDAKQIIGSERVDGYRNKAQYPVGENSKGELISGFYAKRSHRIVECERCKLQSDEFAILKDEILLFFNAKKVTAYNEETNQGLIRHIYIRKAEATDEIMVCIVATSKNIPFIEELIEQITAAHSNIKSIIVNINKEKTNVILGNKCVTLFGNDYITDIICGTKIKISALSFYQVNKNQAEVLYEKAIEYADLNADETLIDLYCGTGTIGLIAASKVKRVIGVEIIPQAIENAKENAMINGIANASFICSDAKIAASKLAKDGVSPDAIIVDPPRKGLDSELIDAIVEMSPKKLVMVSCNPATAARDVKLLVQHGYAVQQIQPVDMFPHTSHVEAIILMTYCGDKPKK